MDTDLIGQIGRLKANADSVFKRTNVQSGIKSENLHCAGRAWTKALQDLYCRGLAGSVWTEQAKHFTLLHREINAADRFKFSIGLVKVLNRNDRLHGSSLYGTHRLCLWKFGERRLIDGEWRRLVTTPLSTQGWKDNPLNRSQML